MTDNDDRLALVEAELARLRADRAREEAANQALEAVLAVPEVKKESLGPAYREFVTEQEANQRRHREERERAKAEQECKYEEQLARNAPELERLQAKLAEIAEQVAAEHARHANTLAALDAKAKPLRAKEGRLQRRPEVKRPYLRRGPRPELDVVEYVAVAA